MGGYWASFVVSASAALLGLIVLPRPSGSLLLSLGGSARTCFDEEGVGPLQVPSGSLGLGAVSIVSLVPSPPRSRGIIRMGVFELARSQSVIDEPFVVT